MTKTKQLINTIYNRSQYITPKDRDNGLTGILDFISTCFAAQNKEAVHSLIQFAINEDAKGKSSIIGYEGEVTSSNAALINGFIAHILDFDDVHSSMRGHPSAIILPSLLSISEHNNQTFNHFIDSYIIGVEMATQIGETIGSEHYENGWHASSTIGLISATVACSYYLNLDTNDFANAIGIAVTQASGLRGQFGSDIKALHIGLAAQKAYWSTRVAQKQILKGNQNMLDDFYGTFGNSQHMPETLIEKFGKKWSITNPGLWFKLYPCCSANYHLIDAINSIKATNVIPIDKIETIDIIFPSNGDAALKYTHPTTGQEGAFSAEYVSSLLLLGKHLNPEQFLNNPIQSEIHELMAKVHRLYDDTIVPNKFALPKNRFTIVKIKMNDGTIYKKRIDTPKGSPYNPLAPEEHLNKLKHSSPIHWENIKQFYQIINTDALHQFIHKGVC